MVERAIQHNQMILIVEMKDSGMMMSYHSKMLEMMETVKVFLRKMTASMRFHPKNSKANLS